MNLYYALTELRRQKWQLPIWADQICINQDNIDEKVAQLAIMVDIYELATCVNIWLGKLSMARNSALDVMDRLLDEPQQSVQLPSAPESARKMNKVSRSLNTLSSLYSAIYEEGDWMSVSSFLVSRQWFSRAWTLQEFLLATKFRILTGNREISPQSIVKATSQVIMYATSPLSAAFGFNALLASLHRSIQRRGTLLDERDKFKNGKRYSAEEYLGVIRVRDATVLKDKVFAGAALLKPGASGSVDYCLTTLEIYISYASERLWPETRIFSLSLVGGTASETEGLPSWVPDLNKPLRPEPLRYCGCPTFGTPLLSQDNDFRIDDRTLHVKAAKWDVVKEVGESIWSWTRYNEEAYNGNKRLKMRTSSLASGERFGLMFALINKLGNTYVPTGERTTDVFWQTLIGGINLKSEDNISVWIDRFQQWFAFTLLKIRSNFEMEKQNLEMFIHISAPKQWMTPLIAESANLEQRVSSFLDFYDQQARNATTSESTLRETVSHIAKRLLDAETFKQIVRNTLSLLRRDPFYEPINVFWQHFETIYDGRRIFTSEKGYLGTGVEAVKTGDLILLVAGAEVPYIFRPVAGKERTFTLVGEAYVHGIMSGADGLVGDSEFAPISII
ncbi:MAG: hypothetical protein M1822_004103 [Bathelium mastoideum]|nr:MAG: hypothetical protein M1822_004103 [Bathelium mastoideum]